MARVTVTDLKLAIKHVNERMLGSKYSYSYDSRNGFHVVDIRKEGRLLYTAGIGTARECISGLYSDAFDKLYDEATDRIGKAMTNAVDTDGECGRCGSTPGRRDLTCPECTYPDGSDKF